jgi:hypothetical protein
VTTRVPSGLNAAKLTASRCRSGGVSGSPPGTAQTRAVPGGGVRRVPLDDPREQRQRVRRFACPEQLLDTIEFRRIERVRELAGDFLSMLRRVRVAALRLFQLVGACALTPQQPCRTAAERGQHHRQHRSPLQHPQPALHPTQSPDRSAAGDQRDVREHLAGGMITAACGLAWGANIGWVNFEATGNPQVDLTTGVVHGFAWSPNVGWITLDDGAGHFVAITEIAAGIDSDADGITDAWELEHAGDLATLAASGDADADGIPDPDEYRADTDPLDPGDSFEVSHVTLSGDTTSVTLTWSSRASRQYFIETSADLSPGSWTRGADIVQGADSSTTFSFSLPVAERIFFRLSFSRPLEPEP